MKRVTTPAEILALLRELEARTEMGPQDPHPLEGARQVYPWNEVVGDGRCGWQVMC